MAKFTRRAAARPAELLDAALVEFHQGGFAAAKVAAIAERAGVTVGTVYRYFPSKEALVLAVVERALDSGWSRGREVAEAYATMTAREVIAFLLTRWSRHLAEPGARSVALLVLREAPRFPEAVALYRDEFLMRGRLALERALRHGIDRGEFPLLEVEATARALLGAPLERLLWDETFGVTEDAATLVSLLVRGLPRLDRAAAAPPPAAPAPAIVSDPPPPPGTLRITTLRPPGTD